MAAWLVLGEFIGGGLAIFAVLAFWDYHSWKARKAKLLAVSHPKKKYPFKPYVNGNMVCEASSLRMLLSGKRLLCQEGLLTIRK